jgi:glycosyltransferase involved in cell wall biosynthesis
MKYKENKDLEKIKHIDNIFSCYRSSWFNRRGRFPKQLVYSWGTDILLSYWAKVDNKTLVLDNNIKVRRHSGKSTFSDDVARENMNEYFTNIFGPNFESILYSDLHGISDYTNYISLEKKEIIQTKPPKREKDSLTIIVLYYGYSKRTGGTYVTLNTYVNYFTSRGDKVIVMEKMPTDKEIQEIKPDCIISAQFASYDVNKFIYKWNVPLITVTFGPNQYVKNPDGKYPTLVTYSNKYLKELDKDQQKGVVIRDPINHELYEVSKENKNSIYITLIGDPPEVKGHEIFIELARRFPDLKFLLVTKHKYKDLPENITIQGYIKDIETLKNKVYAKTKILLLPSAYEAFGRVTIEATASDIPCIISDYPGLPEATFGMSNYVSPHQDIDAWEQELQRVIDNYDNEIDKSRKIHEKLDHDRDLKFFRNTVLRTINGFYNVSK